MPLGLDRLLPQVLELQPELEFDDLPFVQFVTKVNLPGDWDTARHPVRNVTDLRHSNGVLVLPDEELGCLPPTMTHWDADDYESTERVFLVMATPRWHMDMRLLREAAIVAEAAALLRQAASQQAAGVDVYEEAPWELNGWEKPTPQIANIIRYMWRLKISSRDKLAEAVWGDTEVHDRAVLTAISRTNKYLAKNDCCRTLEKVRYEDNIQWVE